jgi:ATP-dependent DNA helicase RecG
MIKLPRKESETVEFKTSFSDEVIETLVAFANTKGGTVYIGIGGKGEILGIAISNESVQNWINEIKSKTYPNLVPEAFTFDANGKTLVSLFVQDYPIKPVAVRGRYYKRAGNSNHLLDLQEISSLYLHTYNSSWDSHSTDRFSLNDISLEKVQHFIGRANKIRDNGISDDPLTVLRKFELIKEERITNACHLLFASQELFSTSVQIGRFSDPVTIKDDRTIRSDLLGQIEEVFEAVKKHLNKEIIITGNPQHEERWQYPLNAIREIIINMIVHRDYQDSANSIIKIFDDRIEFFNPGRLLAGLSVEQLLSGNYISHVRNKKIAAMFKEIGIIEQYGSGISRVIKAFSNDRLAPPRFENFQHGFKVTVFNQKINVIENVIENHPGKETRIINMISQNGRISIASIAKTLGISERTAHRYIKILQNKHKIRRIGSDKGGNWEVISTAGSKT